MILFEYMHVLMIHMILQTSHPLPLPLPLPLPPPPPKKLGSPSSYENGLMRMTLWEWHCPCWNCFE